MNDIRTQLQTAFSSIQGLNVGTIIAENIVEEGQTYFGYEIQELNQDSDFDKNYTMNISLTGYLIRKNKASENTLEVLDTTLDSIKEKLKSLNFRYSYNDISSYTDGFSKIQVRANARYNELNKTLL